MSQTSYTTAIAVAIQGMIGDNSGAKQIESKLNGEASASIPFGCFVVTDGTDHGAKLPSASSGQAFLGPVVHAHAYARTWTDANGVVHGEVDGTGLLPKVEMNVMVRGRIWVPCETAWNVGDPVFVRYTTDGGSPANTQAGQVGNASGTGRTLDLTAKARFVNSGTAPAQGSTKLALIEVDMTA